MQSGKFFTDRCAGLLRSLGSVNRIELLDALRDGPKNVGQLVARHAGRQSGVSKDLQILHGCGLICREKRGQRVVYTKCALKRQLGIVEGKP